MDAFDAYKLTQKVIKKGKDPSTKSMFYYTDELSNCYINIMNGILSGDTTTTCIPMEKDSIKKLQAKRFIVTTGSRPTYNGDFETEGDYEDCLHVFWDKPKYKTFSTFLKSFK